MTERIGHPIEEVENDMDRDRYMLVLTIRRWIRALLFFQ